MLSGLGLTRDRMGRRLVLGVIAGAMLITSVIGVGLLADWYELDLLPWKPSALQSLAGVGLTYALGAVVEEILFRWIVFRWLEQRAGTSVALVLSAAGFGLAHLTNPHTSPLAVAALAVRGGLFYGLLFIITRSLWVPIGAHFAWNFFEGPVFGAAVSGMDRDVLVDMTVTGPQIWTGGAFGPEGGLAAAGVGVVVASGLTLYAVRTGRFARREPPGDSGASG
jgi:uncharacterized protein